MRIDYTDMSHARRWRTCSAPGMWPGASRAGEIVLAARERCLTEECSRCTTSSEGAAVQRFEDGQSRAA